MKTIRFSSINIQGVFVEKIKNIIIILICSLAIFTNAQAQRVEVGINIVPPIWAPYYENVNKVQYYYLPDIECYYDVWNHDFVYLEDGNWMFGATLPPVYSWFDLNNCFAVVLDYNVHQPWMHFHYYVSHYPRYYYRTVYRDSYNVVDHPMRGFNENAKSVMYNNPEVKQPMESRRETISAERNVQPTRPPQRMEYYGKYIGQPVRVLKNMTRPRR